MANITILLGLLMFCVTVQALSPGQRDCPLSSTVTSCAPKCLQDTECSSLGGKCCPNVCNLKSCVLPKGNTNSGSAGYKGSGGGGSYCGNVKCNSYEKCDLDKQTKRQKCVRS